VNISRPFQQGQHFATFYCHLAITVFSSSNNKNGLKCNAYNLGNNYWDSHFLPWEIIYLLHRQNKWFYVSKGCHTFKFWPRLMMESHCTVYGRPHYFTADSDWHLENVSRCCSFALVVKTSVTENSLSWSFTHSDDSIKASPYKWHAQGILYIVWWLIPFHLLLSNLTQCFKYHSTWFLSYETVVTSQWRSQTSWQKSNYHLRKDKADVDTICPLLDPNFHGLACELTAN